MKTASPQKTALESCPYLVLQQGQQVLKFSLEQDFYRIGRDPVWSDFNIPEQGWEALSRRHAILQRHGSNYRIYDGDGSGHLSSNGLFIARTRVGTEGLLLSGNVQIEIGQDPRTQILVQYLHPTTSQPTVNPYQRRRLDLRSCKDFPVKLGRSNEHRYESMQLDAPTVSWVHAEIYRDAKGYLIRDTSMNGTFVNHQRITSPARLKDQDIIRLGAFTLVFQAETLELFDQGKQIRLDAHGLFREVTEKSGKKVILNQVTLPIEPGQLVALVGGSGAGKSTLMKTLLGTDPATQGDVFLNGYNLQEHFNVYRSQIGYVPQQDIMHRELTVTEVLTFACKLRLPPDTQVVQVVNKALEQVKLSHVKDSIVNRLSGGQLKRVSIAIELLADPWLFFLDEPTSGLDPGLDKEMMHLLRELANQGRTIVLVTHATSNIEVCDRVAFMGRGGYLCYFGQPREALQFFHKPDDLKYFSDIYVDLDKGQDEDAVRRNAFEWAQRYANSPFCQTYIRACLSAGNTSAHAQRPLGSLHLANSKALPFNQLGLLSQRNLVLMGRDRLSTLFALLTAPVGILLIAFTLSDKTPLAKIAPLAVDQAPLAVQALFVFTCAALWVGISGSVQEIIKEAHIYARERLVNLGLLPYISSKVLNRLGLATIQALIITIVIRFGFQPPEPKLLSWEAGVFITVFLTLFASFSFGLMISAFAKNENQASSTLPLVLLPQIIFSGVLFKLKGAATALSWLTISRWSVGAFGSLVDVNAMVPPPALNSSGVTVPMPFEPISAYEPTWHNLMLSWCILILHATAYLVVCWIRQRQKDPL
ncbi:MAG: ATP-binding cassette domain-containing protein [Elainella sp. Prado103]|jgi:ABC-type multidrug transport system ATPase subunit/ABC-type multidrug transport system permease subunit|nr:ATP-binding cassette domain-containing protein [Elainella sp. Prado103]